MFESSSGSLFGNERVESVNDTEATSGTLADSSSRQQQRAYERKFSDFLFLLRTAKEELIIVHHPQVLGDNYEEIVESLNRMGDAGKRLAVVPRNERG